MTGPKPWSDMPELALDLIFLSVGLTYLGDMVMVCKSWKRIACREGFWKSMVKQEFGILPDTLPEHVNSWEEYTRLLYCQRVLLVELGPGSPRELLFQDKAGNLRPPRGVKQISMSKLVDCMDGKMTEIYVYACVMVTRELLLWATTDIAGPILEHESHATYEAGFKGKHVVDHVAQDVAGALVSTVDGRLYESSAWGRSFERHFVADFQQVQLPSESRVLSFEIGCNGVRTAAMADGCVYVWGVVFGLLYEQVGVDPPSMFGLGEGSPLVVSSGQMAAVEKPVELKFEELAENDQIVEVVAGSAHCLARSKAGDVWVWGFNGCDTNGTPIKLASVPTKVGCPTMSRLCNAHMMETHDNQLFAYSEFVCGGISCPIWTPMYNLQYDGAFGPAEPNPWPWVDGELGTVKAHSREMLEMPLPQSMPLTAGCVGYTKHSEGCLRIHVYSDEECRNIREPLRVYPMFDVGPGVSFGKSGNLYYGHSGCVVVKDVRRAMMRDQFYVVDLRMLGLPPADYLTVEKPCGGWLLVSISSLRS